MHTFILLLRGINVGGNNVLPMKELAVLLETLGWQRVKTYLQSGNVVAQTARSISADDISAAIEKQFGFTARVVVVAKAAFEQAVKKNPFDTDDGKTVHFY